jgi:hypothetical protein
MVDIDDAVPGRGWHLQQGVRDIRTTKTNYCSEALFTFMQTQNISSSTHHIESLNACMEH